MHTKVTARLGKTRSAASQVIKVAGKVSPDKAGQMIRLERYSSGRWVKVAARRLRDDSRYVFRLHATTAVRQQVRVVKTADLDNARGMTRAMVLPVR